MITLPPEQQKKLSDAFEHGYILSELKAGLFDHVKSFFKRNRIFCREQGVSDTTLAFAQGTNNIRSEIVKVCLVPFLNQALFSKFREGLSSDIVTVLDYLVWNESITDTSAFTILNVQVLDTGVSYKQILKRFHFFKIAQANYSSPIVLCLPLILRQTIAMYYPKSDIANIIPLENIPTTDYVFEGEKLIFKDSERASICVLQNKVALTARGELNPTGIKKLGADLKFTEFYPDTTSKDLQYLRTRLITVFALPTARLKIEKNPFEHFKNLFRHYLDFNHLQLLAHLKNRHRIDFSREPCYNYLKLARALPLQKWVSVDNLLDYAKYALIPLAPARLTAAVSHLKYEVDKELFEINNENFHKWLIIPALQGVLFLWGALGLVDIAYDKTLITDLDQSPYSGLRYVRLNLLGEHLFQQSSSYTVPEFDIIPEPVFSPDTFTITAHPNDERSPILFNKYAQKVGGQNIFFTTESIFMHNCHTVLQLKEKIAEFKEATKNMVLPPNWQEFLKLMIAKSNPFKAAASHRLVQIPSENTELISLIARDNELKKYIVKAEGFFIIIFKSDEALVKKRLKELGYLWE